MLEGLNLAVGVPAGQQMVQRDAGSVEIVRGARLLTGEEFGSAVAGGSWAASRRLVLGLAQRDPEIEDAQLAVTSEVDVGRLDVAVRDVEPVQDLVLLCQIAP